MKNKIIKVISLILITIIVVGLSGPTIYARAHSSGGRSRSHTSVKSSTPKSTSKSSTSSSVKASTPKSSTTKSSTTGKSYSTTQSSSGRTIIKHETVKPKTDSSGKSIVINNNPTYYTNYRTDTSYPLTNSILHKYKFEINEK